RGQREVAVDGRMMPWEWIAAPAGLFKTDAIDHHADDFLPGPRDIAWDLAGAIEECGLDAAAAAYAVTRYRDRTADASIELRLPFYRTAYLAYRIGYATLAVESLGETADGRRFKALERRYRRSLEARGRPHRPDRRR